MSAPGAPAQGAPVRGRAAVLGLAVLASMLHALAVLSSPHSGGVGVDFRIGVWAPVRGLLAGFDPYAADPAYLQRFGVGLPASFHPPWLLLVLSPTASLPADVGMTLLVVLSLAASWTAAVLVVPPVDRRGLLGCVLLGLLLTVSWPGSVDVRLGQVAWLAVLGLALLQRRGGNASATWGVALLTVHPTFAVPLSLLLAGARRTRPVVLGWVLAAVLSLPVLAVAAHAAGGVGPLVDAVVAGLGDPGSHGLENRVDLVGRLAGGSLAWTAAALVATAVLAVLVRRAGVPVGPVALLAATCWCLALFYAQPYDLGLLIVASFPVVWGAPRLAALERAIVATYVVLVLQTDLVDAAVVSTVPVDPQLLLTAKSWVDLALLLVVLALAVRRLLADRTGPPVGAGTAALPA